MHESYITMCDYETVLSIVQEVLPRLGGARGSIGGGA